MTRIEKENIWELVSKGNYHSCLITTYSFDFFYFEKSVMRILRSKGIGNISIFIDNNIFQSILGKIGSSANSRVYSISPIVSEGCFHPKVYMFFGKSQGLVIIGSGNLTSSGHGKNDEVWGAFHFSSSEYSNRQLFADTWGYFKKLSANIKGFTNEKFRWIKEFTPWLDSLPSSWELEFDTLDENNQVAFLTNNESNIFNQLNHHINSDFVSQITVIAPYFDIKGQILKSLRNLYPQADISVLLDDENGILPLELDKETANSLNFYHWHDCFGVKSEDKFRARLHAKIFHFRLTDGSQFCMFGSANASIAALGTENIPALNYEVSLLMKTSNQNLLSDLGIKIKPRDKKELHSFNKGLSENDVFESYSSMPYFIEAIDKEGINLNIYTDKEVTGKTEIQFYNSWGEFIYNSELKNKNNHYYTQVSSDIPEIMYGCLINPATSEILSNKQIVQDIYILAKTNPDPQKQVLDVLFSGIEQGDELLFSKLIDCISTDDFEIENISNAKKQVLKTPEGKTQTEEIENKILDYEDFKDVSYESMKNQYHLLNSSPSRIADFLSTITKSKTTEIIASVEFDDEELDFENETNQGREDDFEQKIVSKSEVNQEKVRIIRFFERYDDYLVSQVDKLIENSNQNINEEGEVTITDISNFIIALYIAIYYTNRKRQYKAEDTILHDKVITANKFEYFDNLPALNAEIIGKFLLLCTRGFKTYESEYLNERMEKLRREAFFHCLYCISQARWGVKEVIYKNLLLINTLRFLPINLKEWTIAETLTEELTIRQNLSADEKQHTVINIISQLDQVLPRYQEFERNMLLEPSERKTALTKNLMVGSIVFTSRFGFCSVYSKMNQGNRAFLALSRPGFHWNEDKQEFLLNENRLFKLNIEF